jgi:hypothetical protein
VVFSANFAENRYNDLSFLFCEKSGFFVVFRVFCTNIGDDEINRLKCFKIMAHILKEG